MNGSKNRDEWHNKDWTYSCLVTFQKQEPNHNAIMLKNLLTVFALLLLVGTLKAQPPIQIEYLLVPNEAVAEYEKQQQQEMKPLHQSLLEAKNIYAWYHYKSRFPIGADAFYNYIVVTVCSDHEVLKKRNTNIFYQEYITRTEIYYPNRTIRSPDYGVLRTPYISVDFIKKTDQAGKDYIEEMQQNVKPLLDQRVRDNVVANYSIFDMHSASEAVNYDHVLVTRYNSFQGAETPAPIELKGKNLRVKTVLWQLLEIVF